MELCNSLTLLKKYVHRYFKLEYNVASGCWYPIGVSFISNSYKLALRICCRDSSISFAIILIFLIHSFQLTGWFHPSNHWVVITAQWSKQVPQPLVPGFDFSSAVDPGSERMARDQLWEVLSQERSAKSAAVKSCRCLVNFLKKKMVAVM